jgi:hypothetical protein
MNPEAVYLAVSRPTRACGERWSLRSILPISPDNAPAGGTLLVNLLPCVQGDRAMPSFHYHFGSTATTDQPVIIVEMDFCATVWASKRHKAQRHIANGRSRNAPSGFMKEGWKGSRRSCKYSAVLKIASVHGVLELQIRGSNNLVGESFTARPAKITNLRLLTFVRDLPKLQWTNRCRRPVLDFPMRTYLMTS